MSRKKAFYMTDGEIITDFRQAKDQKAQVKILAELNCVSVPEMRTKLAELGLLPNEAPADTTILRKPAKAPLPPMDELRAMELYREGLDDLAIAEALGVTRSRIRDWRLRMHLYRPRGAAGQRIKKEKEETVKKEFGVAMEAQAESKAEEHGREAEMPVVQEKMPTEQREMPADTETLTVKALTAIAQRLMDFGLGEARVSIGGKQLVDFKRVTVELDGGVQIDLS